MNLKGREKLLLMKLERVTSKLIFEKTKMIHPCFGKESGSV